MHYSTVGDGGIVAGGPAVRPYSRISSTSLSLAALAAVWSLVAGLALLPPMRVSALTPSFGAVATDVDLGALSDAHWRELHTAFHSSGGLLLIRGQGKLSSAPGAVKAFARRFGPLEDNEKYFQMGLSHQLHPQHREILAVGNALGDNSMLIRVQKGAELLWHCDDSFRSPQPLGSLFFCVEAPTEGAETWFASGTAALDALPGPLRTDLEDHWCAIHDYNVLNERLREGNPDRPALSADVRAQNPPVLRPLVAHHPWSGLKSLYVPACHIERIVRLRADDGGTEDNGGAVDDGEAEAESILRSLVEHATAEKFTYRHRWRPGDCIVWDNRCTLHAPSAFDDTSQRRLMWRITIEGCASQPVSNPIISASIRAHGQLVGL